MKKNTLVTRSLLPDFDEYCNEIKSLWDNHWLTNTGEKYEELRHLLENKLGTEVVLFSNGHLALEIAIESLDLPKGGEVITTPFTFASTTHAIVRNGLVPVFCDIREDDFTMDASKIEALITDKTVAIVPVHVYGNICDVEAIKVIADKYNLPVIYDAAHAFGEVYKGVSSASFGDISMFSFHATKVFNTIEGGALCFNDKRRRWKLELLKNFGISGPESVYEAGTNAKMTEFNAAMGICNLRYLDSEIEARKAVCERYRERLGNVEGIRLSVVQEELSSNYSYFPVIFDGYKYSRDEVFLNLQNRGIYARKYFYPLVSNYDCYKHESWANDEMTPIAKDMASKVLTLPLYGSLDLEIVDKICDLILT